MGERIASAARRDASFRFSEIYSFVLGKRQVIADKHLAAKKAVATEPRDAGEKWTNGKPARNSPTTTGSIVSSAPPS